MIQNHRHLVMKRSGASFFWWYVVYLIPFVFLVILVIYQVNLPDLAVLALDNEKICKLPKVQKDPLDYCPIFKSKCNNQYFWLSIHYYCSRFYPLIWLNLVFSGSIILVLVLLIITLSLLVSNYLIKDINHITETLHINNQILSFIIIPLTNSLPDLINYNITLRSNSLDLVLGQVIGSNLISFTLIIGLISFLNPFSVKQYKLILFNYLWVLIVLLGFYFIISDGKITRFECMLMSASFLVYITYLIWYDQKLIQESHEGGEILSITSLGTSINIEESYSILVDEPPEDNIEVRAGAGPPVNSHLHLDPHDLTIPDYGSISSRLSIDSKMSGKSDRYMQSYKFSIVHYLQVILNLIDFVIFFLVPSSIDTVKKKETGHTHHDFEKLKYRFSKLKYFHIWYVIVSIGLIYFQQEFVATSLFHFAIIAIAMIALIELLNYLFEKIGFERKAEIKKFAANVAGISNSLVIVSLISVELLKILKNFGVILRISEYLLGLLVFSIVNCINDVIMNVSLSINISPIMGVNSCLGTPLLNILVGIGINGISILLIHDLKSIKFHLNTNLKVSAIGLILVICFFMIYIPMNNWKFDKKLGIFGLSFWIAITTFNFFMEP